VAENLQNLSVNDKSVNTIDAVYSLEDTVRVVIDGLMSKHTPSAVIVDRDRKPVGIANIVDLLLLPAGTVGIMKMRQVRLEKVIWVDENRSVSDALRILKENNVDILAIVDSKGKCIGSLSDREVLLGLGTVVNEIPT